MSNHQAGLFDQVWSAVWGWLERHDSLMGALISVGLGGVIGWVAWKARQARTRQDKREEADAKWRRGVESRLNQIMPRTEIHQTMEKAIADRNAQIAALITRMDRTEARIERQFQEQAQTRSEHLRLIRHDIGQLSERVELLIRRQLRSGND